MMSNWNSEWSVERDYGELNSTKKYPFSYTVCVNDFLSFNSLTIPLSSLNMNSNKNSIIFYNL